MDSIAGPTKVSLVVPTFRERDNIDPLLAVVCPALRDWDHEIILVDDDSPDGTADVVRKTMGANPRIRLIVRRGERGQAGAVIRGFGEASGSILGSINADLSHDASIIPAMFRAIETGAEMAVASRRIAGGGFDKWPWYRRLACGTATALAKRMLRVPLSDPMSGFYFVRRSVFERVRGQLLGLGFKIMLEMVVVGRPHPIWEEPYRFQDRRRGNSKMSWKVVAQFVQMLWRLRRVSRLRNAIVPSP